MVRACLVQLLGNAGEVALGSQEAEHVHQLRVGIRRLRTALRELGELSDRADPGWEDPLREVLQALGQSRDRQVLAAEIEPQLQRQHAPLTRLPPPAETPPRPANVVRRPEFQRTLLRLVAFVETPGGQDDRQGGSPTKLIRRRVSRLHRKIVEQAQDFQHLPLEEQHHERKRLKRLRYLAELAAPLYGGRRTRRYLDALKPAQDVLGQHNDEAVALGEFERLAPSDPRAWFAVGWLRARLEGSAKTGQKALRAIDRAERFWRR